MVLAAFRWPLGSTWIEPPLPLVVAKVSPVAVNGAVDDDLGTP